MEDTADESESELALVHQATAAADACMQKAAEHVNEMFGKEGGASSHKEVMAAFMQAVTMHAVASQIVGAIEEGADKIARAIDDSSYEDGSHKLDMIYDVLDDIKNRLGYIGDVIKAAHNVDEWSK